MTTWRRESFSTASQSIEIPIPGSEVLPCSNREISVRVSLMRIISRSCATEVILSLSSTPATTAGTEVVIDHPSQMPPINRSSDKTSHQGLLGSPDATLLHKTLALGPFQQPARTQLSG